MDWIDIHSHILPGFDDGASDEDEFLAIAREAAGCGTRIIAATPHYDLENAAYGPSEPAESVREHNLILTRENIPLTLIPGMEIRVNAGLSALADRPDDLQALTLGGSGKFLLVDLPLLDVPIAIDEIFFQVQLCGVTPILAHPERNRYLVRHPETVKQFVERGVELQVNSGSLTGIFGKTRSRNAKSLLKEGLARLVASDAHNARARGADLSGAAGIIGQMLGNEAPEHLMKINPGKVLEGQKPFEIPLPREYRKKTAVKRIWSKLH